MALLLSLAACGARTGLDEGNAATDAGASFDAPTNDVSTDAAPTDEPPRPLSPLSTTTVRSRMPAFRWKNPPGADHAALEVCRDRACTKLVYEALLYGESYRDTVHALDPGTYFWRLHPYDGKTRIGEATSATWEFFVPKSTSNVNSAWGSMLDLNGDGFAEVVHQRDASVEVHLGDAAGPAATGTSFSVPTTDLPVLLTSAGDLDGDGFPELVVRGRMPSDRADAALVFAGGSRGIGSTPTLVPAPESSFGDTPFPHVVVAIGDVNDDGYGDVIMTMPGENDGIGRAYVYAGSKTGIATTPTITLGGDDAYHSSFGFRAQAIDVDGDGRLELFVDEASGTSAATLVFALPATTPRWRIDDEGFVGDFDCDGFGDFVSPSTGALIVRRGSREGPSPPETLTLPVGPYLASIRVIGDFDGDGCSDAMVIDSTTEMVAVWRGDATSFLIPGPSLGIKADVEDDLRDDIVSLGDIDGDARDDTAIASAFDVYGVHLGVASGLSATSVLTLTALGVASSQ